MENNENSPISKLGHWLRTSLLVKLLSIGFIVLILLIPQVMIQGIISERQNRQYAAVQEISQSWGGDQYVDRKSVV